MKGHMRLIILWLIKQKPCNGWHIYNKIEKIRGKYPAKGNLYETIKQMASDGFILGFNKERSTEYSITDLGQTQLSKLICNFERDFESMQDLSNMLDIKYNLGRDNE